MSRFIKIGLFVVLIGIITFSIAAYLLYYFAFKPNVQLKSNEEVFFVHTGWQFDDVVKSMDEMQLIINKKTFLLLADKKNYKRNVKAGRYLLKNGMSNNKLINMLRSGQQQPVKLTFNSIRTKNELAGRLAKQLESDSVTILQTFHDAEFLQQFDLTPQKVASIFIPNTYQVYWNISPQDLVKRMNREYQLFWNEDRLAKAKKIGLKPFEVSILASVVQAEQEAHSSERPTIAGLYINRIKRGMPLESCPTVIFAIGDFTIKRVLNSDLEIASPYNTYKNAGLPPGPINLPDISSIDAVLNYEKNDYIFMCAKDDLSGYHYFSKTAAQHQVYAQRYWRALNERGIKR